MALPFDQSPVKDGKRCYRGVWMPAGYKKWQCELYLFGITDHGEKKLRLWKEFVSDLWPEPTFFWDEWSELFFAALCGAGETVERLTGTKPDESRKWWKNVIFWGASSTGKSAKAALWILGNWLVDQQFTMGVLTSTSVKALSERIWADLVLWIGKSSHDLKKKLLEVINSDMEVRWNADDRKGMIAGTAVKSGGDVTEAVDRIKGKHNRRVFVVIDEMTAVPNAIVVACRNLNKGAQEFQLIGMANPRRKDDPCGERSEPLAGWGSIHVDTSIFWETEFGCVVRFDGTRNPGLKDPRLYFYPTQEQLDEDAREKGGKESPEYYTGVRGFIPPSGTSTTVMDEALLDQFNCEKEAIWKGQWEMAAFFDPAFEGGDRRVLYPARVGTFASGVEGVEFMEPVIVGIDVSTDIRWIHYAICDAVEKLCVNYTISGTKYPILPKNVMMDTTGEGGGLFNVMSGRWSSEIRACEFGGGAEKVQVSPNRPTTYHELYGTRVSAMWYRFRRYVEGGQIRGLTDPTTRKELTSRDKQVKNGKTVIEPKKEMKKRGVRSPDFADAAVIGAEFLFVTGIQPAGNTGGGSTVNFDQWNKYADKTELAEEDSYQDEFAGIL